MSRAGAASGDAKPADDQFTPAEEPLAEWERDLLQGTPDDTVTGTPITGNAAGEDPTLAEADEINAADEASAAAEVSTAAEASVAAETSTGDDKPEAEEAATDAADGDE
jgi:small subunit ribosomal protein S2